MIVFALMFLLILAPLVFIIIPMYQVSNGLQTSKLSLQNVESCWSTGESRKPRFSTSLLAVEN